MLVLLVLPPHLLLLPPAADSVQKPFLPQGLFLGAGNKGVGQRVQRLWRLSSPWTSVAMEKRNYFLSLPCPHASGIFLLCALLDSLHEPVSVALNPVSPSSSSSGPSFPTNTWALSLHPAPGRASPRGGSPQSHAAPCAHRYTQHVCCMFTESCRDSSLGLYGYLIDGLCLVTLK